MRLVFAAAVCALLLLATTASTALMAATTPVIGASCGFDGGLGVVSFIYDGSLNPPPITAVKIDNADSKAATVIARFSGLNDPHPVLWTATASFNPGTTTLDVTSLGYHMMQVTDKFGTWWQFPFIVSCA